MNQVFEKLIPFTTFFRLLLVYLSQTKDLLIKMVFAQITNSRKGTREFQHCL